MYCTSTNFCQNGGGHLILENTQCINENESIKIKKILHDNLNELISTEQIDKNPNRNIDAARFSWPLKYTAKNPDPSYYEIANYVDHDSNFTTDPLNIDNILDYNCGTRSYDIDNYNHRGTDLVLWPFPWHKMNNNEVEVIAAEEGIIIYKNDGEFDKNCNRCSNCSANGIYILHYDGSVAWYIHLKNSSVTSKEVGDTILKGEFLGFVGSSGSSTLPHLHFEIWEDTSYTNIIDPFDGTCNSTINGTSWWEKQKPYREPTINKIMTNSSAPKLHDCSTPGLLNTADTFQSGDSLYLSAYYHDQMESLSSQYELIMPDGSIWQTWSHNSSKDYTASYWYWWWILPNDAMEGNWQFKVTMDTQTVIHSFTLSNEQTGINHSKIQPIKMWPNPVNNELNLQVENSPKYSYQILNLLGIKVKQLYNYGSDTNNHQVKFDLSDIDDGFYFIKIIDSRNHVMIKRFLKQ